MSEVGEVGKVGKVGETGELVHVRAGGVKGYMRG